jgi:hypothetical protein
MLFSMVGVGGWESGVFVIFSETLAAVVLSYRVSMSVIKLLKIILTSLTQHVCSLNLKNHSTAVSLEKQLFPTKLTNSVQLLQGGSES